MLLIPIINTFIYILYSFSKIKVKYSELLNLSKQCKADCGLPAHFPCQPQMII